MSEFSGDIHVLYVDDEPNFADVAATYLQRETDRISIETATRAREGVKRLDEEDFDCIISDYDMPERDGIQFLEDVREDYPDLPFILFTGKGSEEVASDAISAGVTDYLQKGSGPDQYTILVNRIENAVERYRARRAVRRSRSRLQRTYERITDGFFAVDTDWRCTHVNEEGAQLVGHSKDELLGRCLWDVFPELVGTPFGDALRTAMETRQTTTAEAYYPKHETWYDVRVYSDTDGISVYFRDVTDRKAHERRFEAIFENPLTVIGLISPDGTLREANRTALNLIDEPAESVAGEAFWETPWWDHSAELQERLGDWIDRAAAGEHVRYEADHPTSDGEMATIDGVIHPVRDGESITELVAIGRDITEQRERERDLERIEERFRAFTEYSSEVVTVMDDDGVMQYQSPSITSVMGYQPEELVGENTFDFVHPDDRARVQEKLTAIVEGPDGTTDRVECRFEAADGSWIWIEAVGSNKTGGAMNGCVVVSREITERKAHEEAITNLHEVATDLTGRATRSGIYRRTIDAAESLLDFDRAAIAIEEDGHLHVEKMSDDVPLEDRPSLPVDEGIAGETYRSGESVLVRDVDTVPEARPQTDVGAAISIPLGDHGVFQVIDETTDAFDDRDRELAELLVRHTESALDLLEREIQLERQNDRLEEFASVVSHDLRNPLTVADGRLELAREDCDGEHLDAVADAIDRMGALVEDLLQVARYGEAAVDPEAIRLNRATRRSWENVETAEATLTVATDRRIEADETRLRQLLENLFRNAVEHGRSDVAVTVGDIDGGLFVEDDGPGIPPSRRDQVFEHGYSTSGDGTGLGLSIVKRVADAHDWAVGVSEGTDGGARFEIGGIEFADR